MKVQALLAVATLALEGALAHPTISHYHLHKLRLRDILTKRNDQDVSTVDFHKMDWDTILKNKDWSGVDFNGASAQASADGSKKSDTTQPTEQKTESNNQPKKEETESKEDSPKKDDSSNKKSSGSSGKCLDVSALKKRATKGQDGYVGNTKGNIIPESNCKSSGDYSLTFVNNRGSKKGYKLWNKIGAGGQQNGMMLPAAHTFDLEDGQSATFTFGPDSQVGFSEDCGTAANFGGVPNCNLGEANFNDHNFANGAVGGSAYDVSMVTYNDIKNGGGSPSLIPMQISADGYDVSSDKLCNYANSGQNHPDNVKCALGPNDASPFHIKAVFG